MKYFCDMNSCGQHTLICVDDQFAEVSFSVYSLDFYTIVIIMFRFKLSVYTRDEENHLLYGGYWPPKYC